MVNNRGDVLNGILVGNVVDFEGQDSSILRQFFPDGGNVVLGNLFDSDVIISGQVVLLYGLLLDDGELGIGNSSWEIIIDEPIQVLLLVEVDQK